MQGGKCTGKERGGRYASSFELVDAGPRGVAVSRASPRRHRYLSKFRDERGRTAGFNRSMSFCHATLAGVERSVSGVGLASRARPANCSHAAAEAYLIKAASLFRKVLKQVSTLFGANRATLDHLIERTVRRELRSLAVVAEASDRLRDQGSVAGR